jgi:hypothetical protein
MPACADGAWVRISVRMDYTSNPSDTFFQPRVNGSLCLSPFAFKSPTDLTSPGTWYLCANTPGKGGSVYLRFLGNDSGATTPYVIERKTGGLDGDWSVADPAVPRAQAPEIENIWSEPLQSSGPVFYRLMAPVTAP